MDTTASVASQIVTTITDAANGLASGLASSVTSTFNTLIVNEGQLTEFAAYGLVFVGVGFVIGLIRWFKRKAS